MCGRYTLIRLADFTDMFPWIRPPDHAPPARFNIAPTQGVAVVANDGKQQIDFFRWGLIPFWAKDESIGSKMINARAETLVTKPAFRTALKRRRCIIPASGFYEWRKSADGKTRTPMYIRMKDRKPFAFAGLWETWHTSDGSALPTCTIITALPNELVANIHNRMAVILPPEQYQNWLDPKEVDGVEFAKLLQPYPAELMEAFTVSRAVNSPANDNTALIDPSEPEAPPTEALKPRKRRPTNPPEDQPSLF
jgi:putative SOS response-associated peptidase YedK